MRYQILCQGFIGDILFATSIAKKLHEQDSEAKVDYVVPLGQPMQLMKANPYIQEVYFYSSWTEMDGKYQYDKIIQIPLVNQAEPATIQFQRAAGIHHPSLEFDIYTLPQYDFFAKNILDRLRIPSKPIIGYDVAWKAKAYNTTEEMINRGVGGPHRNIDWILDQLRPYCMLFPIGLPDGVKQQDAVANSAETYALTASLVKFCDMYIGCEGGLSNLAAGVGTKCAITTDFIFQLYGPKGLFRPCANPLMGPATYYPNRGHIHLRPWISDEEVAQHLIEAINGNLSNS